MSRNTEFSLGMTTPNKASLNLFSFFRQPHTHYILSLLKKDISWSYYNTLLCIPEKRQYMKWKNSDRGQNSMEASSITKPSSRDHHHGQHLGNCAGGVNGRTGKGAPKPQETNYSCHTVVRNVQVECRFQTRNRITNRTQIDLKFARWNRVGVAEWG